MKKIRDFLLKIDVNTRHFEISLQTTAQNNLSSVSLSQNKNCTWVMVRKIDISLQKSYILSILTSNFGLQNGGRRQKIKSVNL